jgi:hypothetical protein
MKTIIERAWAGETVAIGKIAAGTTVTQGMMDQIWDAVRANQTVNFLDLEQNSYRDMTKPHRPEGMNLRQRPFHSLTRDEELTAVRPSCPLCQDQQWVCESHPDKPMDHDDCDSADTTGIPCPDCSPLSDKNG